MRIAFYAPLKPIDHPVPSGDRRLGQLFVAALRRAGHEVEIACHLRTRLAAGTPAMQSRQAALAGRLAGRLVERYRKRPPERRPEAWFTYHLYYKAPDWLGPGVAPTLGIPYVVAEASLAPKRAAGPWQIGHHAVVSALALADAVLAMSAIDAECLVPVLGPRTPLHRLAPFLDAEAFLKAGRQRDRHRQRIAGAHKIDPHAPWLIAVAMMRTGDKLSSYAILGAALARLLDRPWQLLVVGDGPERAQVEARLKPLGARAVFLGERDAEALPGLYAAADLLVWPAINEAIGMVLLEAQAAGIPVVAGAAGGVPEVVRHEVTGLLTPPGDERAFAAAVAELIDAPNRRAALATNTGPAFAARHGLDVAARSLDSTLRAAVQRVQA